MSNDDITKIKNRVMENVNYLPSSNFFRLIDFYEETLKEIFTDGQLETELMLFNTNGLWKDPIASIGTDYFFVKKDLYNEFIEKFNNTSDMIEKQNVVYEYIFDKGMEYNTKDNDLGPSSYKEEPLGTGDNKYNEKIKKFKGEVKHIEYIMKSSYPFKLYKMCRQNAILMKRSNLFPSEPGESLSAPIIEGNNFISELQKAATKSISSDKVYTSYKTRVEGFSIALKDTDDNGNVSINKEIINSITSKASELENSLYPSIDRKYAPPESTIGNLAEVSIDNDKRGISLYYYYNTYNQYYNTYMNITRLKNGILGLMNTYHDAIINNRSVIMTDLENDTPLTAEQIAATGYTGTVSNPLSPKQIFNEAINNPTLLQLYNQYTNQLISGLKTLDELKITDKKNSSYCSSKAFSIENSFADKKDYKYLYIKRLEIKSKLSNYVNWINNYLALCSSVLTEDQFKQLFNTNDGLFKQYGELNIGADQYYLNKENNNIGQYFGQYSSNNTGSYNQSKKDKIIQEIYSIISKDGIIDNSINIDTIYYPYLDKNSNYAKFTNDYAKYIVLDNTTVANINRSSGSTNTSFDASTVTVTDSKGKEVSLGLPNFNAINITSKEDGVNSISPTKLDKWEELADLEAPFLYKTWYLSSDEYSEKEMNIYAAKKALERYRIWYDTVSSESNLYKMNTLTMKLLFNDTNTTCDYVKKYWDENSNFCPNIVWLRVPSSSTYPNFEKKETKITETNVNRNKLREHEKQIIKFIAWLFDDTENLYFNDPYNPSWILNIKEIDENINLIETPIYTDEENNKNIEFEAETGENCASEVLRRATSEYNEKTDDNAKGLRTTNIKLVPIGDNRLPNTLTPDKIKSIKQNIIKKLTLDSYINSIVNIGASDNSDPLSIVKGASPKYIINKNVKEYLPSFYENNNIFIKANNLLKNGLKTTKIKNAVSSDTEPPVETDSVYKELTEITENIHITSTPIEYEDGDTVQYPVCGFYQYGIYAFTQSLDGINYWISVMSDLSKLCNCVVGWYTRQLGEINNNCYFAKLFANKIIMLNELNKCAKDDPVKGLYYVGGDNDKNIDNYKFNCVSTDLKEEIIKGGFYLIDELKSDIQQLCSWMPTDTQYEKNGAAISGSTTSNATSENTTENFNEKTTSPMFNRRRERFAANVSIYLTYSKYEIIYDLLTTYKGSFNKYISVLKNIFNYYNMFFIQRIFKSVVVNKYDKYYENNEEGKKISDDYKYYPPCGYRSKQIQSTINNIYKSIFNAISLPENGLNIYGTLTDYKVLSDNFKTHKYLAATMKLIAENTGIANYKLNTLDNSLESIVLSSDDKTVLILGNENDTTAGTLLKNRRIYTERETTKAVKNAYGLNEVLGYYATIDFNSQSDTLETFNDTISSIYIYPKLNYSKDKISIEKYPKINCSGEAKLQIQIEGIIKYCSIITAILTYFQSYEKKKSYIFDLSIFDKTIDEAGETTTWKNFDPNVDITQLINSLCEANGINDLDFYKNDPKKGAVGDEYVKRLETSLTNINGINDELTIISESEQITTATNKNVGYQIFNNQKARLQAPVTINKILAITAAVANICMGKYNIEASNTYSLTYYYNKLTNGDDNPFKGYIDEKFKEAFLNSYLNNSFLNKMSNNFEIKREFTPGGGFRDYFISPRTGQRVYTMRDNVKLPVDYQAHGVSREAFANFVAKIQRRGEELQRQQQREGFIASGTMGANYNQNMDTITGPALYTNQILQNNQTWKEVRERTKATGVASDGPGQLGAGPGNCYNEAMDAHIRNMDIISSASNEYNTPEMLKQINQNINTDMSSTPQNSLYNRGNQIPGKIIQLQDRAVGVLPEKFYPERTKNRNVYKTNEIIPIAGFDIHEDRIGEDLAETHSVAHLKRNHNRRSPVATPTTALLSDKFGGVAPPGFNATVAASAGKEGFAPMASDEPIHQFKGVEGGTYYQCKQIGAKLYN